MDEFEEMLAVETSKDDRPHIFFMMVDDQGYGDIGYANSFDNLRYATPTLDTMAKNGIKLTQYYTQHLCTPARAALLTGFYPIHMGMQHSVVQPEAPFGLPTEFKIMPHYLKSVGSYDTYMVGKWHLGHFQQQYLPYNRGFDHFFGYLTDQLWYYNHKSPHACAERSGGYTCVYDMTHNGRPSDKSINVYSTFLFRDIVGDILEAGQNSSNPTFMYIAWQAVHAPLDDVPRGFFSKSELSLLEEIKDPYRKTFAGMTITLDSSIKDIMGMIRKYGYYDKSLIIYASDNGGCSMSGGYNYPLRGGKQFLFEGGVRVNSFIYSPMLPNWRRGIEYGHMFHVTDWLPTIVEGFLGDGDETLPKHIDGVNHYGQLMGRRDEAPRDTIVHNIDLWNDDGYVLERRDTPQAALRKGDLKLVVGFEPSSWYIPQTVACEDEITKYCSPGYEELDDCITDGYNRTYLFNITADPYETTDLARSHPNEVQEMQKYLEYHIRGMVWPVWMGYDYDDAYATWLENHAYIGPFFDNGALSNKTEPLNSDNMADDKPHEDDEMKGGQGYEDDYGLSPNSGSTERSETWHAVEKMFEQKWHQPVATRRARSLTKAPPAYQP